MYDIFTYIYLMIDKNHPDPFIQSFVSDMLQHLLLHDDVVQPHAKHFEKTDSMCPHFTQSLNWWVTSWLVISYMNHLPVIY